MSRPETTTVLWARLFNAITRAIPTDRFVSLSEREAITAAVWDEMQPEIRRLDQRAEQAEALADEHAANARELGERLRQAEAERDRLRAADGRVREMHKPASYPSPDGPGEITYCVGCEESDSSHPCLTLAALDQAPAAEQPRLIVPTGPPRDPHATGLINDDEQDGGGR